MTLNLGPLALPLAPALLLLASVLTIWVARRVSAPEDRESVETALWWALLGGLLAARGAHVLSHLSTYTAATAGDSTPLGTVLHMLDIRDGGFRSPAGVVVGLGVLGWRLRRRSPSAPQPQPPSRRAVWATALGGLVLWWGAGAAVQILRPTPGQSLAEIEVLLQPMGPEQAPVSLQSLSQASGKRVLVLNLWATWCGPCRAEMPMLAQAQREHPEVLFVFANQGEGPAAIHAYLQRERLDLQSVWRDAASALGPAVGSGGLPTTVVFDPQGRRVAEHMGALSRPALEVMLKRAGAKAP